MRNRDALADVMCFLPQHVIEPMDGLHLAGVVLLGIVAQVHHDAPKRGEGAVQPVQPLAGTYYSAPGMSFAVGPNFTYYSAPGMTFSMYDPPRPPVNWNRYRYQANRP